MEAIGIRTVVSVPYGDHVCLNWAVSMLEEKNKTFPSPMGIMSVSISNEWCASVVEALVSVPYGDHVCLNANS